MIYMRQGTGESMHMEHNIYLIGFMGAGKSSVSRALAEISGLKEIDMDEEIVKRENQTIPEIFEKKGEAYFRDIETEILAELAEKKGQIISCGGGTILREENRKMMKESGEVVYLSATPETIYERVKNGKNRPLLNGHMNVEYIRGLMGKRMQAYRQAKTREVTTDGKNPAQIAKEILSEI